MILDSTLFNPQHPKVWIKGKVEQSKERISALPYTSCSSYWKRKLQVAKLYIYIYTVSFCFILFSISVYIYRERGKRGEEQRQKERDWEREWEWESEWDRIMRLTHVGVHAHQNCNGTYMIHANIVISFFINLTVTGNYFLSQGKNDSKLPIL